MVLYKRKPVTFLPPPEIPEDFDLESEVWVIETTGEWFLEYEDYLSRMNYYNIKKFVCETSGNSNFTFFEALDVERTELRMMENNFPDPVKEPILRYISFSTIPRIDIVVDDVYSKFKDDFFPMDKVMIKTDKGEKLKGTIREKARFNAITLPDGSTREGFCSYRVLLQNDEEITVNESRRISRLRNTFTKFYVKTFLKMSIGRANRLGSPWVVKPDYAKKYRISLEYPENLKEYEFIMNEPKPTSHHKKKKPGPRGGRPSGSSSGPVHIFDSLKETPPTGPEQEAGLPLPVWKHKWYEVLKRATVFFDDSGDTDGDLVNKNKILQLFEFAGVTICPKFDPEVVNFIVTLRGFSNKTEYQADDIFFHVHDKKIKVWHYEKCFRFFKSLNITNRKIEQAQRDKLVIKDAAQLGAIDGRLASPYSQASQQSAKQQSKATLAAANTAFVNILPAPESGSVTPVVASTPGPTGDSQSNGKANGQSKDGKHSTPGPRPATKSRSAAPINDILLPFTGVSLVKPTWHKLQYVDDCSDILEVWLFLNMLSWMSKVTC
ncbi:unnamed protein product [Ambrosiozyma monospora]|uniref:Unnamed protein product n=1 Tax=Ambrosiozyma monospora TaxID=43982 RepID=A0A9W7DHD6_AMBMO|nr:unnamed protein product [Ambrosiozyma monospora]